MSKLQQIWDRMTPPQRTLVAGILVVGGVVGLFAPPLMVLMFLIACLVVWLSS